MATDFDVSVCSEGAVGFVVFSRPPHNYFDLPLIEALASAVEAFDQRAEIGALVLASEGKAFCAGAKFSGSEGDQNGSDQSGFGDPSELYKAGLRLFRTKKPLVAAVQGPAIGGGLGLCLAADFRVVSPEARFSANFARIGIHPGFGLTHTLPHVVGPQNAARLFYTGRRIDGAEALRIGLADVLAPSADLRQAARALAAEIAESAPLAVEATRATLRAGLADAVAAQVDHECREQIALFKTEDFKEGLAAVAGRRAGAWKRR